MKAYRFLLVIAALVLTVPAYAQAVKVKETAPGLLKRAKVTPEAATATARSLVPKGKIVSAEIEEEDGKLLYSFDIKTAGKSGIDEVNVDAISGKGSVQHESPQDEAKEKAADMKKKP